jgi:hypothetical protein
LKGNLGKKLGETLGLQWMKELKKILDNNEEVSMLQGVAGVKEKQLVMIKAKFDGDYNI